MPPVLLLEFEGVLVDTRAIRRAALARALTDEGAALDDAELDALDERCTALPTRDAVRCGAATAGAGGRALDETALELATLRAERYFAELLGKGVSLAPGARELVEDAAGGARLALVTRASRREVEFVLGLAGLDAAFEVVVAAEDVAAPKPSPEGYRRALERLARRRPLSPADALALEDSARGVRAARAAGVRVIAVGADM